MSDTPTLSREDRITRALQQAPKNDTEARECRALGITVEVNADMLALLQEDNAKLTKERDDARDWIKAANQFAWAHERNCPGYTHGGAHCNCGLDTFLGRPRPYVDSWRSELLLARDHWQGFEADCKLYESDIAEQRAEIARLREALNNLLRASRRIA